MYKNNDVDVKTNYIDVKKKVDVKQILKLHGVFQTFRQRRRFQRSRLDFSLVDVAQREAG